MINRTLLGKMLGVAPNNISRSYVPDEGVVVFRRKGLAINAYKTGKLLLFNEEDVVNLLKEFYN